MIDTYKARATAEAQIRVFDCEDFVRVFLKKGSLETAVDVTPRQARRIARSLEMAAGTAERFDPE